MREGIGVGSGVRMVLREVGAEDGDGEGGIGMALVGREEIDVIEAESERCVSRGVIFGECEEGEKKGSGNESGIPYLGR